MSKQKKASFETSVRSNRIVLASSIPIDLARMYFIQSPQSFADRSPTNHTQFLSCNRPGRQPTRQPQTELWQTARAGQNQPYHLRPYLLTYPSLPYLRTYLRRYISTSHLLSYQTTSFSSLSPKMVVKLRQLFEPPSAPLSNHARMYHHY